MIDDRYTCPCCGYRVFHEEPGSFEICPVCFWEDDALQLKDPLYEGGANRSSLYECQATFAAQRACEQRFAGDVREPRAEAGELLDPEWRRLEDADLQWVRAARDMRSPEYVARVSLYYWKR